VRTGKRASAKAHEPRGHQADELKELELYIFDGVSRGGKIGLFLSDQAQS
jgi:hypothetical protein